MQSLDNALSNSKPKIIYVCNKWMYGDPSSADVVVDWGLRTSLQKNPEVSSELVHFDEYFHIHKETADKALIELCRRSKPAVLFISWLPDNWLKKNRFVLNPRLETLRTIRRQLGIPVFIHFSDIFYDTAMETANAVEPVASYIVSADCTRYLKDSPRPDKFLFLLDAHDSKLFYDPGLTRDIDLSFLGSTFYNPGGEAHPRIEYLKYLKENHDILIAGGVYHDNRPKKHLANKIGLTSQEYANLLQRSKLTVNIGIHPNGSWQAKGRFNPAKLCGALVLEAEHPDVHLFFDPYKEYVPFNTKADLSEKIRYYLEHDYERIEIAERGKRRATDNYNGIQYWRTILAKAQQETTYDERKAERSICANYYDREEYDAALPYLEEQALEDESPSTILKLVAALINVNGPEALDVPKQIRLSEKLLRESDRTILEFFLLLIDLLEKKSSVATRILDFFPNEIHESIFDNIADSHYLNKVIKLKVTPSDQKNKEDIKELNLASPTAISTAVCKMARSIDRISTEGRKVALKLVGLSYEILYQEHLLLPRDLCIFSNAFMDFEALKPAKDLAINARIKDPADVFITNYVSSILGERAPKLTS